MNKIIKQPYFIIGFIIIFILFGSSAVYHFIYKDNVPKIELLYGKNHQLIDKSPLSPEQYPPLGTDRQGYSMLQQLLIGAKFTIGSALVIAIMRIVISFVLGIFYGCYFFRFKKYLNGIVDSFGIIPMSLFAYLILNSVLMMDSWTGQFAYSFWYRVIFEGVVLTVIAIPVVSILLGNEIGFIMQKEYIQSARTLGGSRWHTFCRHVMPFLFPRLCIIFAQQTIQVLIIMAHLGLLGLFFGGTLTSHSLGGIEMYSFSNEWSGLIGYNRPFLQGEPWLVIEPLILFTITIISFSFMLEGIQKSIYTNYHRRRKVLESNHTIKVKKEELFTFIER